MRYRRHPDALWRRSFDSVLVLRPGENEVTRIAGAGVVVWLALATALRRVDLIDDVAEAFAATRHAVEPEIERTLDALVAWGCVEELS